MGGVEWSQHGLISLTIPLLSRLDVPAVMRCTSIAYFLMAHGQKYDLSCARITSGWMPLALVQAFAV